MAIVIDGQANDILVNGTSVATDAEVANAVTPDATETVKGKVQLATTAEVQAGTNTTKAVTPAGLRAGFNVTGTAPMYACRAWVNFNGTGTVAIRGSGNVSSITDNGVGAYTVNFTTAMQDIGYSANISGSGETEGNARQVGVSINSYSTTSIKVYTAQDSTVSADHVIVNVTIFR